MSPEERERLIAKSIMTVMQSLKMALREGLKNKPGKVVRMCVDIDGAQISKIVRYNKQNGKFTVSYHKGGDT